mgnify:CR=1 FL=1
MYIIITRTVFLSDHSDHKEDFCHEILYNHC